MSEPHLIIAAYIHADRQPVRVRRQADTGSVVINIGGGSDANIFVDDTTLDALTQAIETFRAGERVWVIAGFDVNDETPLYWGNGDGFVSDIEQAERYSEAERAEVSLPFGGEWFRLTAGQ